jgi:hypothetical protein
VPEHVSRAISKRFDEAEASHTNHAWRPSEVALGASFLTSPYLAKKFISLSSPKVIDGHVITVPSSRGPTATASLNACPGYDATGDYWTRSGQASQWQWTVPVLLSMWQH